MTKAPSPAARISAGSAPAGSAPAGLVAGRLLLGRPWTLLGGSVPRGRDVVFWHTGGVLDAVAAAEGRS